MTAPFDFAPLLAPGTPAPAAKWNGFPKYNFIGGHNDAKNVPVQALIDAATAVLKREGATLATYGLNSGPLGYKPLREFLSAKLKDHAGIDCASDEILITSGSMQGLDLINSLLVTKGDHRHHRAGDLRRRPHQAEQAGRQRGRHPARP